ncbi:unnamed protein product [Zymoseptoria tritici ST99CH_1A5]|uniref:Uncharacterized protein n=4 Tax=Zymoseptoria tritici TaxID=1047171 RepID=F9X2F9_ZYMTI|nr:uncharacterized protein MYCGRDRAFT_90881 [Zymoseptoria tritici IPO323]SMQ47795.1 unnamed protein product [Zymoseptoria tritici ST99CH_3D7]SMR46328.1 unnamed protein product [Zymoseptoria tritici ST99CH_1E4]SMR47577.1 unnamed protein product [Zymoseptoria tritici ST99CH_3D1]SMY21480.1 unnamed protein product [Zymoseptoria tritici ST99CH_1A5]EGP90450.1 hypothetical protein MYCGRDRAFT_90881 [Zymoseptoria tritici IPO323]
MASQHHFADRLRNQLNEANARNLELQALLAHKDDLLAASSHRFQSAHSALPPQNHSLLHQQLQHALEAAKSSDQRLQESCARFDQAELGWKAQIKGLQIQIDERNNVLAEAAEQLAQKGYGSDASSVKAELKQVRLELERTKTYAAGLKKQFEVEKRENSKSRRFPATAVGKGAEDDQDDDEVVPDAVRIKMEAAARAAASQEGPVPAEAALPASLDERTTPSTRRASISMPAEALYTVPMHRQAPLTTRVTKNVPGKAGSIRPPPPPPASVPLNLKSPVLAIRSQSNAKSALGMSSLSSPSIQSSQPSPAQPKRKRMVSPDADFEDDSPPTPPNSLSTLPKRRRTSSRYSNSSVSSASIAKAALKELKKTFKFKASTGYDSDDIVSYHTSQDLSDSCAELWDQILDLVNAWEASRGTEWRDDICIKYRREDIDSGKVRKPCVSTRLLRKGGGLTWRAGDEDAKWACERCVRSDKPCFAWDGEDFWLLPLHEEDRKFEVKKDFEIRTWLNVE